jgi:exosortase
MTITRTALGNRWIFAGLLALFGWAYWTTLADVKHHWDLDPLYSHGYLVPGFACVMLWLRKDMLKGKDLKPCAWGLALIALGTVMRLVPLAYGFTVTDRYSILPTLAGLVLGLGGWPALLWAWPGIAFLLFMLHLPAGVDLWLAAPLQRVATLASTNALQTLGFFAVSEGNVILLSDGELNVAEACSGLNMLVTFCAMTTAVAVLTNRSLLQRLFIVASCLPLAVACNVVRIALTGALKELVGAGKATQMVFHDLAGYLMIFLGLALLWLELTVLSRLFDSAGGIHPAFVPSADASTDASPTPRASPNGVDASNAERLAMTRLAAGARR